MMGGVIVVLYGDKHLETFEHLTQNLRQSNVDGIILSPAKKQRQPQLNSNLAHLISPCSKMSCHQRRSLLKGSIQLQKDRNVEKQLQKHLAFSGSPKPQR